MSDRGAFYRQNQRGIDYVTIPSNVRLEPQADKKLIECYATPSPHDQKKQFFFHGPAIDIIRKVSESVMTKVLAFCRCSGFVSVISIGSVSNHCALHDYLKALYRHDGQLRMADVEKIVDVLMSHKTRPFEKFILVVRNWSAMAAEKDRRQIEDRISGVGLIIDEAVDLVRLLSQANVRWCILRMLTLSFLMRDSLIG